jgi:hypothetical protein
MQLITRTEDKIFYPINIYVTNETSIYFTYYTTFHLTPEIYIFIL